MIALSLLVVLVSRSVTLVHGGDSQDYQECRRQCMENEECISAVFASTGCHLNLPGTEANPAESCLHALNAGQSNNGKYWVSTPSGTVQTTCDIKNGGWTLIGETGGYTGGNHLTWLRENVNTEQLAQGTEITQGQYACIDAVDMAVNKATKIRLASGGSGWSMGEHWVEWELPAGRDISTFWNVAAVPHSNNLYNIGTAVTVMSQDGTTAAGNCYQNIYGLMPRQDHGASYPSTTYSGGGYAKGNDLCFSVMVMKIGTSYNGWSHNGNGRDCPRSNTDWPNTNHGGNCFLAVWIK